jgi:hypothetical protein
MEEMCKDEDGRDVRRLSLDGLAQVRDFCLSERISSEGSLSERSLSERSSSERSSSEKFFN